MTPFAAALASLTASLGCTPLPGMEAVLAKPETSFLLFGEYHGTVEMPQVTSDAICAVAASGRPVVVGIEFPPENQPYLDQYLRSRGRGSDRQALLQAPAWKEEGGRSTAAIVKLIESARRLRASGKRIAMVAFDLVPAPIVSKAREEGLAQGLSDAQARVPRSMVVALTGSGHAGKSPWSSQNPPFPATGQLLPPDKTLAFAFARAGGKFWGCDPATNDEKDVGCAEYGMPVRESIRPRGLILDSTLRDGFDGIYSSGTQYRASKPASKP